MQRVPAWHLVINYPQSVFVPALFLLLDRRYTESPACEMQTLTAELAAPPLDTMIRTEKGPCTYNSSCLAFGDKLPKVNICCSFSSSSSGSPLHLDSQ